MTDIEERDPVELEKEGVPGPLSTTYVVPGREQDFPPARRPGLRLRVVPNETLLPGPLGDHLGELVQQFVDVEVIALFAAGLAAREAGRLRRVPGWRISWASAVACVELR